jgi:hypothetical protein
MTSARYVRLAVLLAVLLVGFSSVTYADTTPVDPKMVVSDPTCGLGCTVVEGTTFTFSSNGIGGGITTFENASDSSWSSLLIETTGILASNVNASSPLFANPTQVFNIGDLLVIYFSGVSGPECFEGCFPGISNQSDQNVFTINLNDDINDVPNTDPAGSGGWGPNLGFTAEANVPVPAVPEPATLTLMAAGLGTFLAKKKLSSRKPSQPLT